MCLFFCTELHSRPTSIDGDSEPQRHVFVIGATTRIDTLDASLRRAGRFDEEIGFGQWMRLETIVFQS
jgi:SpoVK/Ycf46/Vps4 family AAA+-type ATPase